MLALASSRRSLSSIQSLPHGIRVNDVADACRNAALAFAWGGHFWTKRELARWLLGPYARAVTTLGWTRSSVPSHALLAAPPPPPPPPPSGVQLVASSRRHELATVAVASMLANARAGVIASLRQVWSWQHDASFARDAIEEGLVTGIVDDASHIGYAPVDAPRMLLVDRVRSLFIADYLTRPRDYESFAICPRCSGATFEVNAPFASAYSPVERECCVREPRSIVVRRLDVVVDDEDDNNDNDEIDGVFDLANASSSSPTIEIRGEFEIDIDIDIDDDNVNDFDDYGDLRDTIIDPIEASTFY